MHPTESDFERDDSETKPLRVNTPFTPSRPSSVHVTTTTTYDERESEGYFPCASLTPVVSVPDEDHTDMEEGEEFARLSPMRPAVVRVTTRRNTVVEKSEANVPEHVAWEERWKDGEKWDHEV